MVPNLVFCKMDICPSFFYLKRGCRQGDPISPYIFILCAEVLGQMIRNNNNIKGIFINEKEFKISQYAIINRWVRKIAKGNFKYFKHILFYVWVKK